MQNKCSMICKVTTFESKRELLLTVFQTNIVILGVFFFLPHVYHPDCVCVR